MLITQYIKMYSLEFLRNKSAVFFTLIFPSILLLLFWRNIPPREEAQWFMLAAVINYGVQSSMFQTMGMSIAYSRQKKWAEYLKFLPVSNIYVIFGRVLSMWMFALLSIVLVVMVACIGLAIPFTLSTLSLMILIGLLGGIPMGLLAAYLGNIINPTAARSIFVIINLLLFFSAFSLPDSGWLSVFRTFVPSYQWLTLSYGVAKNQSIDYSCLFGLIGYSLTFYFLAVYGIRKK